MDNKNQKQLSLVIADLIKPILMHLQIMMANISIEDLEETLNKMMDFASTQRAFPFPATQNAADLNEKKNKLFKAILNLVKAQRDVMEHKENVIDDNFLRKAGLL